MVTGRNNIDRLVSEEVFFKAVAVLLVGLPVIELFTEIINKFDERIIPSYFQTPVLALYGIFGTLLTILYWVSFRSLNRKFRIADIFYFTLLFFMIISAVFSLNPGEYAGGSVFYCEYPAHFLAYYWLYFAGTLIDSLKYRKKLLFIFLFVALLEGVFAFFQTFDIEFSYCLFYHVSRTAYGLTQNSNFYGGMCILFLAGVSGMYIFADTVLKSKVKKYAVLASAAFLFYTMIGSRARLAWVGFFALLFFYVISLLIMLKKNSDKAMLKKAIKRALILLGTYFVVFLITLFFTDYIIEVSTRSYWEVANGNLDRMGSDRIYNWRMGLATVPDHWLTGVGLDNYKYVFVSAPGYHEGMYMNEKGHNEYIHTLVTQGVPALINYLALLIYAGSGTVKRIIHHDPGEQLVVTWILLGMFITYVAQALFNSSINYVVIYFWLILGLVTPRTAVKIQNKE